MAWLMNAGVEVEDAGIVDETGRLDGVQVRRLSGLVTLVATLGDA